MAFFVHKHASLPRLRFTRRRGFTLVELIIVAALIALFSGLAVIAVQQQYRSNIRKATIAETRNIASALDFAALDTNVFPKLCWLTESREGMAFVSNLVSGGNSSLIVYGALDINSRNVDAQTAARFQNLWKGPYFSLSQTRAGAAQGRGGFVYMTIPSLANTGGADNPASVNSQGGIRWPSDPYYNPYVVYMLDIVDPNLASSPLAFVNEAAPADPTRKGNFVNAVVSYGSNRYPGGLEDVRGDFGPISAGNAAANDVGQGPYSLRLYRGAPNFTPANKGFPTYTMLSSGEYNRNRANVWGRRFTGFVAGGLVAQDPNGVAVGITDPASDDVIFEF